MAGISNTISIIAIISLSFTQCRQCKIGHWFNISNIAKTFLILCQALVWVGFLFTPLLPMVSIILLLLMFYMLKWSTLKFLKPPEKLFRATNTTWVWYRVYGLVCDLTTYTCTDKKITAVSILTHIRTFYMWMLVISLFIGLGPITYAMATKAPNCGPFSGAYEWLCLCLLLS